MKKKTELYWIYNFIIKYLIGPEITFKNAPYLLNDYFIQLKKRQFYKNMSDHKKKLIVKNVIIYKFLQISLFLLVR